MAETTDALISAPRTIAVRLRRARLGLLVALTPILMLFVSFTSAYVVRQGLPSFDPGTNTVVRDWRPIPLPNTLFLINTSAPRRQQCDRGIGAPAGLRSALPWQPVQSIPGVSLGNEKEFPWLGLTIILGIGFLTGQFLAWRDLAARGFFVATGPSSSFVYLLTGVHAIHLLGGILALLVAGSTVILHRRLESRHIVVDVTAWYWHFMALLWIYILTLMEFAH